MNNINGLFEHSLTDYKGHAKTDLARFCYSRRLPYGAIPLTRHIKVIYLKKINKKDMKKAAKIYKNEIINSRFPYIKSGRAILHIYCTTKYNTKYTFIV